MECLIYLPAGASGADVSSFCGGPGLSAATETGAIVEFASSPQQLSEGDAELVGETLLVGQPE